MRDALNGLDYAVIAAYLLGMMALGAFLATRIRHFKDYFLAGGVLTTPLLICTLVSTYYGLDVTFGTSESAFYDGLSAWCFYSVPYYVTIVFAALVIAPRLRRRDGMMTISDVLEDRYGRPTRVVSAIACLIYNAPILQMFGMITMLKVIGLPVETGVVVAIAICAAYTVLGGLWADAVSDTLQFVLMCVTLALVIPLGLNLVGGFSFLQHVPAEHLSSHGGKSPWLLLAWATGGLTVLVEPTFYNRVFAARDGKSVRNALLLGIALWAAYDWGVVIVGMMARAAVASGLPGFPADLEGKEALLRLSLEVLPQGLRGLFLGGVLASAMSTIDSYSLLASGNLVYDIYHAIHRRLSDRWLLRLTRIGVFVVMAGGAVASLMFDRIREAWLFMASVLVSVVLVPTLGAVFARPARLAGLLGALFGMAGLVAFYVLVFRFGITDPNEESQVWRLGPVEIWQQCAALFALPVSFAGYLLGNALGRSRNTT